MRIRRLTLLIFAIMASIVTIIISFLEFPKKETAALEPAQRLRQGEVLVLTKSLDRGDKLEGALKWEMRDIDLVGEGAIVKEVAPDAESELSQARVKRQMGGGNVLTRNDYVSESKELSLQLKPNMRAMAVNVSVDTSAGGFILPNDRVDVIVGRRRSEPNSRNVLNYNGLPNVITETVLRGIRVLAIDQATKDEETEESAIIGKTATLELTASQSEIMVAAQQVAETIVLTLRAAIDQSDEGIAPANEAKGDAEYLVYSPGPKGGVRIITNSNITEVGVRR